MDKMKIFYNQKKQCVDSRLDDQLLPKESILLSTFDFSQNTLTVEVADPETHISIENQIWEVFAHCEYHFNDSSDFDSDCLLHHVIVHAYDTDVSERGEWHWELLRSNFFNRLHDAAEKLHTRDRYTKIIPDFDKFRHREDENGYNIVNLVHWDDIVEFIAELEKAGFSQTESWRCPWNDMVIDDYRNADEDRYYTISYYPEQDPAVTTMDAGEYSSHVAWRNEKEGEE